MGWAGTYRTLGPKGFASYALSRAVAAVPGVGYRRYQLIALVVAIRDAADAAGACRPSAGRAEIRHVAHDLELSDTTIDFRLRQGMTCVGAFRDGAGRLASLG